MLTNVVGSAASGRARPATELCSIILHSVPKRTAPEASLGLTYNIKQPMLAPPLDYETPRHHAQGHNPSERQSNALTLWYPAPRLVLGMREMPPRRGHCLSPRLSEPRGMPMSAARPAVQVMPDKCHAFAMHTVGALCALASLANVAEEFGLQAHLARQLTLGSRGRHAR